VAGRVLTIGTNKFSGGTSGSGTSDHAALSNLTWTASGHTGTPARLAGFFEGGAAGYAGFGPGMYLDGSDNIAVSNDIIAGATLGATSLQPANTSGWTVASHDDLYPRSNPSNYITAAQVPAQTQQVYTAQAGTVTGPQSNLIATAWQNPASATNWTWTSDGVSITLTGYTGPTNVVIPDMLDGLPVTIWGPFLTMAPSLRSAIRSVDGGANLTTLGENGLQSCTSLTRFDLRNIKNIDAAALAFTGFSSLDLSSATNIGITALAYCTNLVSVTFGKNAPPEHLAEFEETYEGTPSVTNYVADPTATGWGATWNGRPVVRLNTYANESYVGPSAGTNRGVYASLTNLEAQIAGKVDATPAGIAAAGGMIGQADIVLTYTNDSAISMTATVGRAHCWTLTSTGTASIVITGWSATTSEQVKVSLVCTGLPTIVFPTGAGTFTNGVFSSNAPTMGKYNSGVFMHDQQAYYSLWLNSTTPMGTP
jgi:hypothetical protein